MPPRNPDSLRLAQFEQVRLHVASGLRRAFPAARIRVRVGQDLVGDRASLDVDVQAFTERFFPHVPEVKTYVDGLGRRVTPDLVLAPRLEDRHQDHRVVAELAWQAFRDHLVLEYEIVKYEGDLGQPNVFVPLSGETVAAKVDHLFAAFPSQAHRSWFDAEAFRAILRLRGIEANAPSGYAEGYTARKAVVTTG